MHHTKDNDRFHNPEVSIIVPVYNVDKYLRECLDSIQAQTFNDWECIVVDDGSTDNSGSICDEYSFRDDRFIVIHQENGGQSSARNNGIDIAKGRFIAFVDSDDSLYPNFLEKLYKTITTTESDVVQVNFEFQYNTFSRIQSSVKEEIALSREQVIVELMNDNKVQSYLWNKMFKKDVINSRFPEGNVFEDIYVLTRWAENIHKMVIMPDVLYSYRQRMGSTLNSKNVYNRLELVDAIVDRARFLHEIEPAVISTQMIGRTIWRCYINSSKTIARLGNDPVRQYDAIKQISDACKSYQLPSVKILGLKKWIRGYILRNNPRLYFFEQRFVYMFHLHKRRRMSHLF